MSEFGSVHTPFSTEHTMGGVSYRFRFDNGYGASVIRNGASYGGNQGLWELAVLEFSDGDEFGTLTYVTPITDDVLGWLETYEVADLLNQVSNLER